MRRLMALLAVYGIAASAPAALAAPAAPGLGGYSVRAQAAPVTVELWEPVLPTPTEPQGELSFSYTRSTMDTGPSTRALASSLWPGETLGEGFGTVIGQEDAQYPVKSVASYPGGAPEASQEPAPGVGMDANAGDSHATARAGAKAASEDANADDPGGELLASARSMSSISTVSRTGSTVSARADAVAGELALLGGLITVDGVRLRSTATSDGAKGSAGGTVDVAGLRIADQRIRLGENGLGTGEGQDTEIPDQPAPVAALLKTIGITVQGVRIDRKLAGPTARQDATALVISIDTTPLRQALDGPLSAIRAALPDDVASELAVLFEASPRIVYRIGNTSAVAGGSPAIDFQPLPTGEQPGASASDGPEAGAMADGGTPADAVGGVPEGDSVPADAPPPTLASEPFAGAQPVASFGGVPGSMLAGALLLAGVIGLGVRRVGAAMLAGSGTCELGAIGGIAHLRKG